MNSKDPIKAKIHELLPDLLELKFGCQIMTRWNTNAVILGVSKRKTTKSDKWYRYMHGVTSSTLIDDAIVEILGRSIQLADVLRALDDSAKGDLEKIAKNLIAVYDKWNLLESYDGQSEETRAFIGELLGV